MKKTPETKSRKVKEMAAEYRFDHKKAKPNRFAKRMKDEPLIVMVDPDIAKIFKTSEDVNNQYFTKVEGIPKNRGAGVRPHPCFWASPGRFVIY